MLVESRDLLMTAGITSGDPFHSTTDDLKNGRYIFKDEYIYKKYILCSEYLWALQYNAEKMWWRHNMKTLIGSSSAYVFNIYLCEG